MQTPELISAGLKVLRLLDKYIVKEVIISLLGVIVVLLVILLGNTTMRLLGKIVEGALPSSTLLPLLTVNMVHYLTILLPLSIYLGILLAMGRLYKDSEMSALSACGIGTKNLYRPVMIVVFPVVIVSGVLSLYASPWVSSIKQSIKHQAEQRSKLSSIVAGRFNEGHSSDSTMFVEALSDDRSYMKNIFLHGGSGSEQSDQDTLVIETADSAHKNFSPSANKQFMVFNDGRLHSVSKNDKAARIIEFKEHGIEIRKREMAVLNLKTSATPTSELWGSDQPKLIAELQWRISVPLACLLLALLALPLSYTTPRKGRYSKFALGILIYLVYTNLLGIARGLIEREHVAYYIGMSWPHMVLICVIVIMLRYQQIMMARNKWALFWKLNSPLVRSAD